MCVSRRHGDGEEREAGEGKSVLIYREAWLGERQEREKLDNATVRGVVICVNSRDRGG